MFLKIKRMDKRLFLGAFLSPIIVVLFVILLVVLGSEIFELERLLERLMHDLYPIMVPILILYLAFLFVFNILFHYRMWAAVYDERVDTTPATAVIFLLIPFYNLYWIFKFYPGFVEYFNSRIARYNLDSTVQQIDSAAFSTYPTVVVVGLILGIIGVVIPLFSLFEGIVNLFGYILMLIIISKTCDAVNALADAVERNAIAVDL